jgi:hypothetical protein
LTQTEIVLFINFMQTSHQINLEKHFKISYHPK